MWNFQQGIERTKQDRLIPNSEEIAQRVSNQWSAIGETCFEAHKYYLW